jgi:hypothetical protein
METMDHEEKYETNLTDQNEIIKLLDKYQNNYPNEDYLNMLLFYYMILSPENCKKYKINKIKTEEETLFAIVNDLIYNFGDEAKNKKNKITKKDLYNYVDDILNNPAKDELKDLNIKEIPSRWNNIYKKAIYFENETNNELIFYYLTNDLLLNIKDNKEPFDNIYFLKEFMILFKNFKFKIQNIPINIKKFLLLGLCNCEYIEYYNGYLDILTEIVEMENLLDIEKCIKARLNSKYIDNGILKTLKKFVNSKLASSAFIKIFNSEIPQDLQEEIFTDKITKYIYFLPYSSYNNTERTVRRFSLILINPYKNKKFVSFKNSKVDALLTEFSNIVVRKLIFGHEHQHLSGGLLFFEKGAKRLSTPPHKIDNRKITYNENSEQRGERGEIFELLSYGKVFKVYSIFDLLFIADERNDELDIDEYHKKYQTYHNDKNKILLKELENFPKGQTLSKLVYDIYCKLLEDEQSYKELIKSPFIARKDEDFSNNEKDITLLENAENLITPEICPFSLNKEIYQRMNFKIK